MSPSGAVASSDIVTGPLEQSYRVRDPRRGRAARGLVRIGLPEAPYWVRLQDRLRQIREAQAAGQPLLAADQAWLDRAAKAPVRQLFLPDTLKNTLRRRL